MIATNNLIASKPESEKNKFWVAILLYYPNLWSSEVTVFFDKEYYDSYIPKPEDTSRKSICNKYRIVLPTNLYEIGYNVSWDGEDENGNPYTVNEERWTIGEHAL